MYFILFQNTDTLDHMPLIGPFIGKDVAESVLDSFIDQMDMMDEFTAVYAGEVVESVSPVDAVAKYISLMPGFGTDS